jgi:hypothetical protein
VSGERHKTRKSSTNKRTKGEKARPGPRREKGERDGNKTHTQGEELAQKISEAAKVFDTRGLWDMENPRR